jgi:predicted enzyme related to lactoylglutathione lyase
MEKRVTGIGGVFIKYNDPEKIRNWYTQHLGLHTDDYGTSFEWRQVENNKPGFTIWSAFKSDSNYFAPSTKEFMINFRVADLEALLAVLKTEGIEQLGEMQVYEYGKFAHILDPEGNKIELWEPNDDDYKQMAGDAVTS